MDVIHLVIHLAVTFISPSHPSRHHRIPSLPFSDLLLLGPDYSAFKLATGLLPGTMHLTIVCSRFLTKKHAGLKNMNNIRGTQFAPAAATVPAFSHRTFLPFARPPRALLASIGT